MATGRPSRPLVRWHGGKWILASWIIENLPPHRIYVEPFGGAGSVLLKKPRSYAEIYNDRDGDIVNLFRVARDRGPELVEKLRLTPFSRDEFIAAYERSDDPLERARRLVVKCYQGFGTNSQLSSKRSGFRSNSNRSGTTPAHDWANYPDALAAIAERLRGVVIENRDASRVIENHDSEDAVFYVDPPYLIDTRGDNRADYVYELTREGHVALARQLRGIRGRAVVSGYPHPLYEELYQGWTRLTRRALADGARERLEVLWIKP